MVFANHLCELGRNWFDSFDSIRYQYIAEEISTLEMFLDAIKTNKRLECGANVGIGANVAMIENLVEWNCWNGILW